MKKPWFICIASLIVFLVCTVAGAADRNNSDSHNSRGHDFVTARTDSSPIHHANGPNQDFDHSRNGMSRDNNDRNDHHRDSHHDRNGAMDRGPSRDRVHGPNMAHNDRHRGSQIVNAPYNHRDSHDRNGHQDTHSRNGHRENHDRNGHHDNQGHNGYHDFYSYNWHHHEPGYCNANFEILCQRKCGDVSPTSCGGHRGFGNHCNPHMLRKCMDCGFLSGRPHGHNGHHDAHGHNGHQNNHGHNGHYDANNHNGHQNNHGHNGHRDANSHNNHQLVYGNNDRQR